LQLLVVSSGWWIAVVQLWPAGSRPYVGGSTDDNVLNLALGYNGVDRIVGGGERAPEAEAHLSGWATHAGIQRLFSAEMGYEISWLLPAVAVAIIAGVYVAVRGRLDRTEKATLAMWMGWFVVSAAVFSYMTGMVHPYYTIALAPAMGALIGLAGTSQRHRGHGDRRMEQRPRLHPGTVHRSGARREDHLLRRQRTTARTRPQRCPDRRMGGPALPADEGRRDDGIPPVVNPPDG
jgi:4-amino-4-deoxy-L-arabinose transferase-like glycosyltransferase